MNKNHVIKIMVTKDFKMQLTHIAQIEGFESASEFVRETMRIKLYQVDKIEKLCRILEKDEDAKNTTMASGL